MMARPALKPISGTTNTSSGTNPAGTTGTAGTGTQKITPSVGRLSGGFNPVSISTQRTAATNNRSVPGPTSAIAAAKAALFERTQAAAGGAPAASSPSPTTPTTNPLRTSISSVSSISSLSSSNSISGMSSPTTPTVASSPFRKQSIGSINAVRDVTSPTQQVPSPTFLRKTSIGSSFNRDASSIKLPTVVPASPAPTAAFPKPAVNLPSAISTRTMAAPPAPSIEANKPTPAPAPLVETPPTSARTANTTATSSAAATPTPTTPSTPMTMASLASPVTPNISEKQDALIESLMIAEADAPLSPVPVATPVEVKAKEVEAPVVSVAAPVVVEALVIANVAPIVAKSPVLKPAVIDDAPTPIATEPVTVETPAAEPESIETPAAVEPEAVEPIVVDSVPTEPIAIVETVPAPIEPVVIEAAPIDATVAPIQEPAVVEETVAPVQEVVVESVVEEACIVNTTVLEAPIEVIEKEVTVESVFEASAPVEEVIVAPAPAPVEEIAVAPAHTHVEEVITTAPALAHVEEEITTGPALAPVEETIANLEVAPIEETIVQTIPIQETIVEAAIIEGNPTAIEEPQIEEEQQQQEHIAEEKAKNAFETMVASIEKDPQEHQVVFSKTKEEMLQSAPVEPILNPVMSSAELRTSSPSCQPGHFLQKFHWKHGGEIVKVTGTFDDWKESIVLKKVPSTRDEFFALVDLDRTQPIQFKFVVDGVWRCSTEFETEYDYSGNLNNILRVMHQ
ncbi:hypothetical protein BGZ95_011453 [Linnemannia exigua]|uniref:AMP-activated protein kinase glycogen-binding domain-containing protein n=1 Tax=Linnemannia exigua TaxID=604196 RepID=A0AAD4DAE1_9FUNG|nr:hypothetical protein BGZ95_011453 [Linnemannia exigua]